MTIESFFSKNSLHDSYIIGTEYDLNIKVLSLKLVQLFSELSITNETDMDIKPTDQVELEILLEGIEYICHDITNLEDNEIYSVESGNVGDYDVIMIQLLNDGLYNEMYIRGTNIDITANIIRIINNS